MAYEPTVWQSGDVVTSAKLNKLEGGVAGADGMFVTFSADWSSGDAVWSCDKTFAEIKSAFLAGKNINAYSPEDGLVFNLGTVFDSDVEFVHLESNLNNSIISFELTQIFVSETEVSYQKTIKSVQPYT